MSIKRYIDPMSNASLHNGWPWDISLGMEDGAIPDTKITASSWTLENPPHKARLYSDFPCSGGAWCPYKAAGSYLQVDLGALHHVTAVATQGNPTERGGYVTQFTIQHSTDGQSWCNCEEKGKVKVFQGNTDNKEIKIHYLTKTILTRFLRVVPQNWNVWPCMRIEIFGKPACEGIALYPRH